MLPVGLFGSWIFISTLFVVNELLAAANGLGLPNYVLSLPVFSPSNQPYWSVTLGQVGILSGKSLDWAATMEVFTRTSLPQFSLHVAIALLYLSWLAIWWALRQRGARQPHSQLLKG
jgi:hypothetical protein